MNIKDLVVSQTVNFNADGAFEERFQLEFGGTFIEDLSREDLRHIMKCIDSALIYGAVVNNLKKEED